MTTSIRHLTFAGACALCGIAYAGDTYNATTGQLSIPSVQVGTTLYSDVVVSVTVDKINSVGSAAPAPTNPVVGSWGVICNAGTPAPAGPCSPAVSYVLNLNTDGTFNRSLTYLDGSAISTENGTYSGSGGLLNWVVTNCTNFGNPLHNLCDSPGTKKVLNYTIFGSGVGSVMTLTGLSSTQILAKITP